MPAPVSGCSTYGYVLHSATVESDIPYSYVLHTRPHEFDKSFVLIHLQSFYSRSRDSFPLIESHKSQVLISYPSCLSVALTTENYPLHPQWARVVSVVYLVYCFHVQIA